MKFKASMVVMSHLSDAQEMIGHSNPQWANDHINFVKFVIMKCNGDLTQKVDADLLWKLYVNRNTFKHPELQKNEIFLINVKDGKGWEESLSKHFKSLRRGNIAYVTNGSEIVPDYKPLFGIPK